jgi:hypothetical protein
VQRHGWGEALVRRRMDARNATRKCTTESELGRVEKVDFHKKKMDYSKNWRNPIFC